jgi:hypothetical protein
MLTYATSLCDKVMRIGSKLLALDCEPNNLKHCAFDLFCLAKPCSFSYVTTWTTLLFLEIESSSTLTCLLLT